MRTSAIPALLVLLSCLLACVPDREDPGFTEDPDGGDDDLGGGGGGMHTGDDDDDDSGTPPVIGSTVEIVAGTGRDGFNGDEIPATTARLATPAGLAMGAQGELFIADLRNHRVRKVSLDGTISTVAGTGNTGYVGDNLPATLSSLTEPSDVAVDAAGDLYIADAGNHRIRKVDLSSGYISTIAGTGSAGSDGNGDPAIFARLNTPRGLAFGPDGDLYIADTANHQVRRIDAATREIELVAGTGSAGKTGDGGPATKARLSAPTDLALDDDGALYIADTGNGLVRLVDPASGEIEAFAGGGSKTPGDTGLPALQVRLDEPSGMALDAGLLYVTDLAGARVVVIQLSTSQLTSAVGTGVAGSPGNGDTVSEARVDSPWGVAVDPEGLPYISDAGSNVVFTLNP